MKKSVIITLIFTVLILGVYFFFGYYLTYSYKECGFSIRHPIYLKTIRTSIDYGPYLKGCERGIKIDLPDMPITFWDKPDDRIIISVYDNVDKFKTVEELLLYQNDRSEGNKYPNIPTGNGGIIKEVFEQRKKISFTNGSGLAIPSFPWDWNRGEGPHYYFFYAISEDGSKIIYITCGAVRKVNLKRCDKIISTLNF